ncbi:MAG: methyltransferase [Alistipes sp.]|nr:methyltransferase [Alistipes sp.]
MFRFKHFTIDDSRTAMKVGTDGVLIGAWSDVEQDDKILDVGTGSGIIAIMAAQRNAKAEITALDIDADAVAQARDNVEATAWGARIECVCEDVKNFASDMKFDHIISNPPYFVETTLSPNPQRSAARSAESLPFVELVACAEQLLKDGGKLSVVLPVESASLFRYAAFERLWLRRLCSIVTVEGDAPKRVLMEFVRTSEPLMPRCEELIIQLVDGSYSSKYRTLTKDFYLNF